MLSWATNITAATGYLSSRAACAEFRCLQHPLTFVHVPKAAGSFVSHIGFQQAGLLWGIHYARHLAWPPAAIHGKSEATPTICAWAAPTGTGGSCPNPHCSAWHLPPSMLPVDDPRPVGRAPFRACIVRDPLLRLLSEYTYRLRGKEPCALGTLLRAPNTSSCHAIARGFLEYVEELLRGSRFVNDCHVIPQVDYVAPKWMGVQRLLERFPNGPWDMPLLHVSTPPAERGCNIVLRYSHLAADLDMLTRWAKLDGLQVTDKRPDAPLPAAPPSCVDAKDHATCRVSRVMLGAKQAGCLSAQGFRALLNETHGKLPR